RVPTVAIERAVGYGGREQDLEIDLAVRHLHAAGVVDRVRVAEAALEREAHARQLGEPEIAALAQHLAAQIDGIDANGVIGRVAHIRVSLFRRLHVRADTAVPHEVDGCAEYRADERLAVHAVRTFGHTERRL